MLPSSTGVSRFTGFGIVLAVMAMLVVVVLARPAPNPVHAEAAATGLRAASDSLSQPIWARATVAPLEFKPCMTTMAGCLEDRVRPPPGRTARRR